MWAGDASSLGGVFTFNVSGLPSWAYVHCGSAFMLFAGASANSLSTGGGAFAFDARHILSFAWWNLGSANKNISIPKLV